MTTYEKNLQARKNERIRIAKEGGDVQSYLRNERNAALTGAAKAETKSKDYQLAKSVETPMLDASVGNTPDFVAPSSGSGSERKLTNEEQALEIMGLLNPVDFSPEAVAERNPADDNNVFNYAGRMFAGGAANSLRGIANDISYSAQRTVPQQTAENAIAAYRAGGKFPEAEKAFQEYMNSIPQNQRDAMEITGTLPTFERFLSDYVQKNTETPELKKAVSWGENYNKETAELYPERQGSVIGDVAAGLGGMVPAIAASFVPGVGGFLGKAAMFSSARGNAIQQAIDNGASYEDAEAYGTAVGGIELATEALFGGLGKIGKKLVGKGVAGGAIEKYITSHLANNPAVSKAITRVINGLGEGAEEYLSEWGGWMADKATIQQDERSAGEVSGDAAYSLFVGTLISGFMQASDLMSRGQSAQEAMETAAETETPMVDAVDLLTNPGRDPQKIPGTRSHAEYTLASPARKARFEQESGIKLTGTKAEQRNAILQYYRNAQAAPEPGAVTSDTQQTGNPLYDALTAKENAATGEPETAGGQYKTGASHSADANAPAPTANTANVTTPVVGAVNAADAGAPAYTAEPEGSPTPTVATISQNGQGVKGPRSTLEQTVPTDPDRAPKESQTYDTAKSAKVTPDYMASLLDLEGEKGGFEYMPITNNETVQQATQSIIRDGWESSLADWTAKVRAGQAGDQVTATGALLYNNAVTSGDEMLAMNILTDYSTLLRNTARGLQAGRILKRLTPSSRLYMIQRQVNNFAEKLNLPDGVTISPELQQEYLKAKTEAERDRVIEKMQKHVARQIPSTMLDKWTALRYVNMLGNFKTQIRNVVGNAAMRGTAGAKNLIATSLERLVYSKDSGKRTKSFVVSKELKDAARNDFDTIRDIVLGESKYSTGETEGFMRGVEKERQIFKFMPLEAYRKLTNAAMEGGDILFSKSAYARALAGHLKANGISAELFNQVSNGSTEVDRATRDKIDKARLYAIQEAQEATFRDNNMFSSWISKIGRRPDTPKVGRLLSEGIMPFRKTPANVLVRAEEYSPLGLINTAVKAVQATKGTNDITGSDVINSLSKSLTGTGIFLLGMALRNAGWLTGGEDDEKQAGFNSLQGQQEYALSLPGDVNITLDWVSPASIPLFMGVQLMDEIEDGGFQLKDLEAAMTSITDPLIQMSMLQGANDTLDSIKYSDNNLVQIGVTSALSYLTQGLTNSLLGQAERTSESNRMETFRDRDSDLPVWLQSTLGKASAKIPGWDYNQVDYVDAWGRTTDYSDNPLLRALNQGINPSYVSMERTSEVETELQRLYDGGMDGVFPTRFGQSDQVSVYDSDGNTIEKRYLSAEEYEQFNRTKGQTSLRLISDLMESGFYRSASDSEKAEAIGNIYEYANAIAKMEAEPTTTVSGWIEKAKESGNPGKYIELYTATQNIEPMPGNENPSAWQKVEYIVGNASTKDADEFIPLYLDNLGPRRYEMAREHGFTPEMFMQAYKAKATISSDRDENGKSLENVKDKYVKYLMEEYGWPEAVAKKMYKFMGASAEKLDNWTW